jgi:hypothetical protein
MEWGGHILKTSISTFFGLAVSSPSPSTTFVERVRISPSYLRWVPTGPRFYWVRGIFAHRGYSKGFLITPNYLYITFISDWMDGIDCFEVERTLAGLSEIELYPPDISTQMTRTTHDTTLWPTNGTCFLFTCLTYYETQSLTGLLLLACLSSFFLSLAARLLSTLTPALEIYIFLPSDDQPDGAGLLFILAGVRQPGL